MSNDDAMLVDLVEAAPEYKPRASGSRDVSEMMDATAGGVRRAIDWPWPLLSKLSKALMSQTVTMLAGPPAATKSLFSIQAAAHWHAAGIPVAIYMLEDSRAFHLSRALAQRAGNSKLTDDEWVRFNPDVATAAVERHREFLDSFGRCIHAKPRKRIELKAVGEWVTNQAAAGSRIIIVDPITAASTGAKRWLDDGSFVDSVKIAAEDYNSSIILVNHTDRMSGQLRGGQVYEQLCHTVLTIKAEDSTQMSVVRCADTITTQVNRLIYIQKARLGIGTGSTLGFYFDPETLLFAEQGIIPRKAGKGRKS